MELPTFKKPNFESIKSITCVSLLKIRKGIYNKKLMLFSFKISQNEWDIQFPQILRIYQLIGKNMFLIGKNRNSAYSTIFLALEKNLLAWEIRINLFGFLYFWGFFPPWKLSFRTNLMNLVILCFYFLDDLHFLTTYFHF